MANQVRFGLTLANRGVLLGLAQPEELLQMAEQAEASGAFEHVWVGDSIMAKPRMESITLMSAIAARTRWVKIGVACMASFPSRDPTLLAYQWASLDLLSNGRMILGACMGGSVDQQDHRIEYRNMGIKGSDRAQRMEENITILRKLWTADRVTSAGEFHNLQEAFIFPKPVRDPPPGKGRAVASGLRSYPGVTFAPRITPSPRAPGPRSAPPSSMIATSTPVPVPTDPGLRSPGGSGLHAIWCAASVIP